MKLLLTLVLLSFAITGKGQQFASIKNILSMKSDQVIKQENSIKNGTLLSSEITDVKHTDTGFDLYYSVILEGKVSSRIVYSFDKLNKCIGYITIQDVESMAEQIKYMVANGFKRVSNTSYINSELHLLTNISFNDKVYIIAYHN